VASRKKATVKSKISSAKLTLSPSTPPSFAEAAAWKTVGTGWRPLFGKHSELGFSFEWHEFTSVKEFDWAASFHPASLELCLNLDGHGSLDDGTHAVELSPQTFAFYYQGDPPLIATRKPGQSQRFITIEYSPAFLGEEFNQKTENLHPLVQSIISGNALQSSVVAAEHLTATMQQLVESLRQCPVFSPAQEMWFRSKALEIASHLFFQPQGGELFCTRTQRLARERVSRAQVILQERLHEPPSLEELSKMVSCSPFYLSRLFTQEAGMTMQQYLRRIRMDRAAELLRNGKCNVTEAALEVGYNSLSHFSSTFHETFGCCPGLYPLRTPAQSNANDKTKGS
jgi:AraC-like DNA-binding protein